MREARLILPENDNTGAPLKAVHEALQDRLCEAFGGFTLSFGRGGWKNDAGLLFREPVMIYNIAMETADSQTLRFIARGLLKDTDQEAISLRLPTGEVVFEKG